MGIIYPNHEYFLPNHGFHLPNVVAPAGGRAYIGTLSSAGVLPAAQW
jgi:hypothetical protein